MRNDVWIVKYCAECGEFIREFRPTYDIPADLDPEFCAGPVCSASITHDAGSIRGCPLCETGL